MAIAEVGAKATFSSGTANILSTTGQDVTIAPTAGNALVAATTMRLTSQPALTLTGVGGTVTFANVLLSGASTTNVIYIAVNVPSGVTAINFKPTTSGRTQIWMQEYSGVDNSTPQDVTATSANNASSTSQNSASITPATNGAVVVAMFGNAANAATSTPFSAITAGPTVVGGTKTGTGWAHEHSLWNQGASNSSTDLTVATNGVNDITGAYQCNWTLPVAAATTVISVVLRPDTSAPPSPTLQTYNYSSAMQRANLY